MERTPNLSIVAVHLVVLWTGALLAIHGSLSVGALVSFNGIFLMVSQSVYGITFALPDLVRASAAQRRIQEPRRADRGGRGQRLHRVPDGRDRAAKRLLRTRTR